MKIELKNVSKSFGRTQALDQVNVQFGGQKIYGLLGNNGAGKSTMLNIITSRYIADTGEVTLDGLPMRDNDMALGQIYMMSEENLYPETMTVKDAFKTAAYFYPLFDKKYAQSLAGLFQLDTKKKITGLSTGYKSIFKIIMALSVNALFLLLDEPTLGLDATHRDMFYKQLLERYSKNPCTVIMSTHLISEVASIIEHCVIIKDGRIIKDAPCEELGISELNLQQYYLDLMKEESA